MAPCAPTYIGSMGQLPWTTSCWFLGCSGGKNMYGHIWAKHLYRHGFGRLLRTDSESQSAARRGGKPAPYRSEIWTRHRTDMVSGGFSVYRLGMPKRSKERWRKPAPYRSPMRISHRTDMVSGDFSVPTWAPKFSKERWKKPALPTVTTWVREASPYRLGMPKRGKQQAKVEEASPAAQFEQRAVPTWFRETSPRGLAAPKFSKERWRKPALRTVPTWFREPSPYRLGMPKRSKERWWRKPAPCCSPIWKAHRATWFRETSPYRLGTPKFSKERWRKPALRTVPTWFRETSPYRLRTPRFSKQRWRKPAARRTDMVWGGFSVPTWGQSAARKGGNQPCAPYRHGFGRLLRTDLGCQSAASKGGGSQPRTVPIWFREASPYRLGMPKRSKDRWRKPVMFSSPVCTAHRTDATSARRLGQPVASERRRGPASYIHWTARRTVEFILIYDMIISNMFANATIHVFPKKFVLRYRCLLICRESKII